MTPAEKIVLVMRASCERVRLAAALDHAKDSIDQLDDSIERCAAVLAELAKEMRDDIAEADARIAAIKRAATLTPAERA